MPTAFEKLMDRGMLAMEAALPEDTIQIGAKTYPGVFSELGMSEAPDLAGFLTDAAASFTVRRSIMPLPPTTGTRLTRAGRAYKVAKVTTDTTSHIIELEDPAK